MKPDSRIVKEETFGPVAPIMTFSTLDEALRIANETEYGLTASVFTSSLHDAWRAAEELEHGTVHINDTTNEFPSFRAYVVKCGNTLQFQ